MILSLYVGHDATACLISDDITAIAEERVSRIKNYYGFPFQAIDLIFDEKGISFKDIKEVLIAGNFYKNSDSFKNISFFNKESVDYSNEFPFKIKCNLITNQFNKINFDKRLKSYLNSKGYLGKVKYIDHHLAHVASSYATYPIEDSVMLSLDGGGDGINWSIYTIENGNFKNLAKTPNHNGYVYESPADIYSTTTKFLGFKRVRHEGKLTGLAAYGTPKYLDYFNNLMWFEDGEFICKFKNDSSLNTRIKRIYNFFSKGIVYYTDILEDMQKNLENASKDDVACSLQTWFEDILIEFICYYSERFALKGKTLLLSGGAFANVLANQKIKNTGLFKNVYVVPNMGDGGLALGAAYIALEQKEREKHFNKIEEIPYYGFAYSDKEILNAIKRYDVEYFRLDDPSDFIAKALEKEYIVGLFTNRMEYGPRALGARSILINPSNRDVNDSVNKRLNRTEFMPFAPYILDVDADRTLENYSEDDYSARFMTMTYKVKEILKERAQAIVHIDGTARPQIIKRENNIFYYDILDKFKEKTGIPTLVNTSFNAHEEPIVMTPNDAIRSYKNNCVDILLVENYVVINSELKNIIEKEA